MSHVERTNSPRAVIHTRILDVAAERPDASLEEIAGEVSAATPALVDRVLDEYGDPADANPASGIDATASMSQDVTNDAAAQNGKTNPTTEDGADEQLDGNEQLDGDERSDGDENTDGSDESAGATSSPAMTDKQRATLAAVHEQPEASQGDIADALDVTRATVSRRLNDIDGFSWDERADFAAAHLDSAGVTGTDTIDAGMEPAADAAEVESEAPADLEDEHPPAADPASSEGLETLADRLTDVEGRLTEVERGPGQPTLDPELVHKVAHACMTSDAISREEELQVLEHLMQ